MDQVVCHSNGCLGRQPGISGDRLGEICFSLGHANRRTGCVAAIQPTFKSDAGTIPHPHTCAYTKGNTHSYSEPYAVTNSSAYASSSPAFTPPPVAGAAAHTLS